MLIIDITNHIKLDIKKIVTDINTRNGLTGFPWWLSRWRICLQCRRHRKCEFDPWVGRIPWKRKWHPLQYSCLKNPMNRGAWWATVHGVAKGQTQLSTRHKVYVYISLRQQRNVCSVYAPLDQRSQSLVDLSLSWDAFSYSYPTFRLLWLWKSLF